MLGIIFLSSVYNNLTMPEFSTTLAGFDGTQCGHVYRVQVSRAEVNSKWNDVDRRSSRKRSSTKTISPLSILWGDDRRCRYRAAELRRSCPCAQCVNEWTGERVLKAESISEKIEIKDLSIVGRYALNFRWSDGHETGIYSFRYLRELCETQG